MPRLMVPDPRDEKPFVISTPLRYDSRSPFSLATRPVVAFDLTTRKLDFLEGYWRTDVEVMQTQEKGGNIALCGMDIDTMDHKTLIQSESPIPANGIIRRSHYRMTLNFVGQSLTGFESSHEFISAIADAMEAHDNAYFDAQILHHDISVGNILFTDDMKGVLIDWDLCANSHSDSVLARRRSRMGTWQFMSAIRQCPGRAHQLEDNRESAFHLLLWLALRYTESKLYSPHALNADLTISDPDATPSNGAVKLMYGFDETDVYGDGVLRGGLCKELWFISNNLTGLKFSGRPALDALVRVLRRSLAVRYEEPPTPEDFEHAKRQDAMLEKHPDLPCLDWLRRVRECTKTYSYSFRMAQLAARGWLVDTLRKHLDADAADWPRDSGTLQQLVPGPEAPRRRVKFYQTPEERASHYVRRRYIYI